MKNKMSISFTVILMMMMFGLVLNATTEQPRTINRRPAVVKNVQLMKFLPDLKITECQALPNNVYKLKVTIYNTGRSASKNCILRVEDLTNKNKVQKKDITFLALKSLPLIKTNSPTPPVQNYRTVIVTCPFTVYAGKYIRATIDATHVVNELNEANNVWYYDTTIK
jgi:hypothetical protein